MLCTNARGGLAWDSGKEIWDAPSFALPGTALGLVYECGCRRRHLLKKAAGRLSSSNSDLKVFILSMIMGLLQGCSLATLVMLMVKEVI